MSKLALLIGINYRGTSSELSGCINDVNNIKKVLIDVFKYQEEDIIMMTDDTELKPTLANIEDQIIKLVKRTNSEHVKELWVSYSGHGSYVVDHSGDEDDKRDECLVPLDYMESGMLMDDALNTALRYMNEETKTIVVIDACHSETMLDLKYRYVSGVKSVVENKNCKVENNCIMISGCKDKQTSADAFNINNSQVYSGAMTSALLSTLDKFNYTISCWRLLKEMRRFLKSREFKQVPQICSTTAIGCGTLFCAVNPDPYMTV
jgi:metacaspase-1